MVARREGREGAQPLKTGKSVGGRTCERTVLTGQWAAGHSPAELTAFGGRLFKNASSYLGEDTWGELLQVQTPIPIALGRNKCSCLPYRSGLLPRLHPSFVQTSHTIITPSSSPSSALGADCSRSMDHFSMMEDTCGFSTLRIRKPVRFTPE